MNWQAINFDWNQIHAFYAAAEEGSLSGAARVLGLTQPTISRQVAGLEQRLDVILFERVGRGLVLTQSGRDMLMHVRGMGRAALGASRVAAAQATTLTGEVKISASDIMATYVLPPILAQMRKEAPGLRILVIATNDLSDLQQREADIALRHVRPTHPNLYTKILPDGQARFYASISYIAACGRPDRYADLAGHDLIAFGPVEEMIAYYQPLGLSARAAQFAAGSTCGIAAWTFVQTGLGVCPMMDVVAQQTPGVVPIVTQEAPIQVPLWLTSHSELQTSQKIRYVFDALATALRIRG